MTYTFPVKEQFSELSLQDARPHGWIKQQMADDQYSGTVYVIDKTA